MTVKDKLLELPAMERNLRAKKKRLEYMKDLCYNIGSPDMTDTPKGSAPSDSAIANAVCNVVDLEKEVFDDEKNLEVLKISLINSMDNLDEFEQAVVIERDVYNKPWSEVGKKVLYCRKTLENMEKRAMEKLSEKVFP